MTARGSRLSLFATMLAFVATCLMSGLSGWHAAHVDEPAPVAAFTHVHAGDAGTDPDQAIHLAAHIAMQGMAIPADAFMPFVRLQAVMAWPVGAWAQRALFDPASVLRPPRI